MFKCNKDQDILAENLMTALMMIAGIRDESQEIENDIEKQQWMMAGVYEENTGLFFFRKGEHKVVQKHFEMMYFSRLQQRKALKTQQSKENSSPKFEPKILQKSKQMAENYRTKQQKGMQEVALNTISSNEQFLRKKEAKL